MCFLTYLSQFLSLDCKNFFCWQALHSFLTGISSYLLDIRCIVDFPGNMTIARLFHLNNMLVKCFLLTFRLRKITTSKNHDIKLECMKESFMKTANLFYKNLPILRQACKEKVQTFAKMNREKCAITAYKLYIFLNVRHAKKPLVCFGLNNLETTVSKKF